MSNDTLNQVIVATYRLGHPYHYILDDKGFSAEIVVFSKMRTEDNVALLVAVDGNGLMSVTANQYRFKRELGCWVLETIKNFFEKFEHPHVTVNGDACHTHYSHLADIAKWAERQAFNRAVAKHPTSILGALKRACPNAQELELRVCDMLYRAIQTAAFEERLSFTVEAQTFITALSQMNLALSLEQILTQIFVVWNYNPKERAIMTKFIELAMH